MLNDHSDFTKKNPKYLQTGKAKGSGHWLFLKHPESNPVYLQTQLALVLAPVAAMTQHLGGSVRTELDRKEHLVPQRIINVGIDRWKVLSARQLVLVELQTRRGKPAHTAGRMAMFHFVSTLHDGFVFIHDER